MIYLQTTVTVAGLLAGWMAGLTAHARYATGWRDPAARTAWLTVTVLVVLSCLLVALILILLAGNRVSWVLLSTGAGVGGWLAWLAAERVCLPARDDLRAEPAEDGV